MKKVSAVIPVYGEEKTIARAIESVSGALEKTAGSDYEVIVVDNASPDKTLEMARRASDGLPVRLFANDANYGKGYSVRRGMLEAEGAWRFFYDADMATPPEEIGRFYSIAQTTSSGVLVGSRLAEGARIERTQSMLRRLAGRAVLGLSHALVAGMPTDIYCGFKWFRSDAAEAAFSRTSATGWTFDIEALAIARHLGFEITEIPITWRHEGTSRLSLVRDFTSILSDLRKTHRRLKSEFRSAAVDSRDVRPTSPEPGSRTEGVEYI